ncbi:hypothetical protein FVE85_9257 [Porphyridium purpureum]|uniref:Uncharacterized protein n=1 Tax=Porphyridium purpureum TaxID=35688 RepID=A0A5J4YP64_PORPP|nr:hypothetical protein FVE85_9257 [Porphyridium purpureum]|eukprot:POR8085..scf222_8
MHILGVADYLLSSQTKTKRLERLNSARAKPAYPPAHIVAGAHSSSTSSPCHGSCAAPAGSAAARSRSSRLYFIHDHADDKVMLHY